MTYVHVHNMYVIYYTVHTVYILMYSIFIISLIMFHMLGDWIDEMLATMGTCEP